MSGTRIRRGSTMLSLRVSNSITNNTESAMYLRATLVMLLALAAAPGSSAQAQAPTRLTLARQLIVASEADSLILRTLAATVDQQRKMNTQVPKEFWDEFLRRARTEVPMLIDSLAPMYAKRFNEAELRTVLTFYQSPVGKKMIRAQGPIQQETMEFGQRWGARLGAAVAEELQKQGVKLQ